MKIAILSTFLTGLIGGALAKQVIWAQCGGRNYNGDKTCKSGLDCNIVNEWYSQCQPETATPSK